MSNWAVGKLIASVLFLLRQEQTIVTLGNVTEVGTGRLVTISNCKGT